MREAARKDQEETHSDVESERRSRSRTRTRRRRRRRKSKRRRNRRRRRRRRRKEEEKAWAPSSTVGPMKTPLLSGVKAQHSAAAWWKCLLWERAAVQQ